MFHHDPVTAEPYIRLAPPLSHIIITPPRIQQQQQQQSPQNDVDIPYPEDKSAITTALNDPGIVTWLDAPPYPYHDAHAIEYIRNGYRDAQRILQDAETQQWVDGCPFRDIRDTSLSSSSAEEDEGKSGRSIVNAKKVGDIVLARCGFHELSADETRRRDAQMQNQELSAGDQGIIWGVGYWLAPSHQGQGIMGAVVQSILSDWAVPRMNVYTVSATTFVGNQSSLRTLEKCGFVLQKTVAQASSEQPESKGGGRRDLHVLKWTRVI